MTPLISRPVAGLAGEAAVPGDKSISHRSLMVGALAVGETTVRGLLEGDDVLRTGAALRALGAEVAREEGGVWRIRGRGVGGLSEPASVLDLGNSGTAARLLAGILATHPFTSFLTGDASLNRRPMSRVTRPLSQMGARFVSREGGRLPMAVIGAAEPVPITFELPVASAQVKSAILLAGLNTPGVTRVIEPQPTRDHSEIMLRHFGVTVAVEELAGGGRAISLTGEAEISGRSIQVPGDPSSAAFPLVAALIVPGSRITIRGVGVNRLRAGLYECLAEMGARLSFANRREEGGEAVADIVAEAGPLRGIEVPPERAPRMIDEYPVLAVAAAFAQGTTRMTGLAELRVKESDRLAATAQSLAACGVEVEEGEDWLVVKGREGEVAGGADIASRMDHRIAMSFLVLGTAARRPVRIDDASFIDTSFPGFARLMNALGADIAEDRRP
ncbi:MAG: 3-phosphoshikimate 1-carboxyvinyltransferase [Proteobacteria bacterium]|nr:3-phosphoshikimate 1-carboxyvinyltransferase [Pseudomonadota bacterium]